jgi:hypothetical protein
VLLAFAVVAGVVGGHYGQPWIHQNDRAVDVIVTVVMVRERVVSCGGV